MKNVESGKFSRALPAIAALIAVVLLGVWFTLKPDFALTARLPGMDHEGAGESGPATNAVFLGKVVRASGQPADLPGAWPRFRGANLDGISTETTALAKTWSASGPPQLWSAEVGEGYAGPVVRDGRVYVMDYEQTNRHDALRCLSLADGKEIWRFAYPVSVKRNHGMSRTVPTLAKDCVVAIGPKLHVICLDAKSGELRWGLDLVRDFGATVPQWYAGQCPLVDGDKLILGVGAKEALLVAVDLSTGKILWKTPNPKEWLMTHSSVMPMDFAGRRQYVYCASQGVVGVSADDGALLWDTPDWKISIANVPSPVVFNDGRIFLSGGYNAGSMMLRLEQDGGKIKPGTLYRLEAKVFGATQHTPIIYQQHLYGIRQDGQFVCLDLEGKVRWASGGKQQFGLGPFFLVGNCFYALTETGTLKLIEATPERFNLMAEAKILQGHEAWGPMALAGGRLIARDSTTLVCLDVTAH